MTPDELRRMIHKMLLQQNELAMRDELLSRRIVEYNSLISNIPVGVFIIRSSSNGTFVFEYVSRLAAEMFNASAESLLKNPQGGLEHIHPDDKEIFLKFNHEQFQHPAAFEWEGRAINNGAVKWLRISSLPQSLNDGDTLWNGVISDITARKFHDEFRDLSARLVKLVRTPEDFRHNIAELTNALQKLSGCEAVGIRLKEGNEYPYYETRGFDKKFNKVENLICSYDSGGNIIRDETGSPLMECLCGSVLCGRFDHSVQFFTEKGSFWSNNTNANLPDIQDSYSVPLLRGQCAREGYASVALIPLRLGKQTFGLLQFNDHRPDRFTDEMIAHYEGLADSLAIALSQCQAEEALRISKTQYDIMVSNIAVGIYRIKTTSDGKAVFEYVSPKMAEMLGVNAERILENPYVAFDPIHPDDLDVLFKKNMQLSQHPEPFEWEGRVVVNGAVKWMNIKSIPEPQDNGEVIWNGVLSDITVRKLA